MSVVLQNIAINQQQVHLLSKLGHVLLLLLVEAHVLQQQQLKKAQGSKAQQQCWSLHGSLIKLCNFPHPVMQTPCLLMLDTAIAGTASPGHSGERAGSRC